MTLRDVIRLMRPRQWTKNLVVFAALIFAGHLFDPREAPRAVLAFLSFCLAASSFYALNDVHDAKRDRQHPLKRERPVASGRVSPSLATALSLILMVAAGGIAIAVGPRFSAALGFYAVLQLLYSFWLKNVAIVDLIVVAAGFVIRAVAGAVAIREPVSPWLVACAALLALFLVTAKRRHELVLLQGESPGHRPVLSEYSAELLDSFMVTLSGATITSYMLYAYFAAKTPYYFKMTTTPFVIYGILRYQLLVLRRGRGGRPEEILLTDVPTLVNIALWMLFAVIAIYVAPRFR